MTATFRLLFVIIALLGTTVAATQPLRLFRIASLLSNTVTFDDVPEARPPFNQADYEPFRAVGKATLTVPVIAYLKSGKSAPVGSPDGNWNGLTFLFPDTAFTRWMFAHYARIMDGGVFQQGQFYPGDSNTGESVPEFLNPTFSREKGSAVRMASSCAMGSCTFRNVPPGLYLCFSEFTRDGRIVKEYAGGEVVDNGITPEGDLFMVGRELYKDQNRTKDAFVFMGTFRINKEGDFAAAEGAMMAAAHFRWTSESDRAR